MTARRARAAEAFWLALALVAGLGLVFHRQLDSGFEVMQTDPGDTRHLNYVLEHNHRSLFGLPERSGTRERLAVWDPEIFYPTKNAAAYTETLLGVTPFYSLFRAGGLAPDTAYQAWLILLAVLNYLAAYVLLRRALALGAPANCLGAFVFAFGAPRTAQLGHAQLIAQFFTLGAIHALLRLFGAGSAIRRSVGWIWVFWACLVAQIYAGVYLAWFFALALGIALLWGLAVPRWRSGLVEQVRRGWPHWLAAGALACLALVPLARHHLAVAGLVGYRDFETVQLMLPRPQAWFNSGPYSWLYSWIWQWPRIRDLSFEWEQRLGLGIVTWIAVLWGLWRERRRTLVQVLALSTATVVALATWWPGDFTFWRLVYETVPGAKAIRAVSRVGLLILVPAMIGAALAWRDLWLRGRAWRAVALAGALVVALEQGQTLPAYHKQGIRDGVTELASAIPDDCASFYYSPIEPQQPFWVTQLDAMWASLETQIPTLNGYSSNLPPGWPPLLDHSLGTDPQKEQAIRAALISWLDQTAIDDPVCWVKQGAGHLEVERVTRVARGS